MRKYLMLLLLIFTFLLTSCNDDSLKEIKVEKEPITTYLEGESFKTDGMKLYAYYNNNEKKEITDYTYYPSDALLKTDKDITIYYKENGIIKTTIVNITVNESIKTLEQPIIDIINDELIIDCKKANLYQIYLNGELKDEIESSKYLLSLNEGIYYIKVKALYQKNDIIVESTYSDELVYTKTSALKTPIISLNENVVSWIKVDKALSYEIYLNDIKIKETSSLEYKIEVSDNATYTIKIKAKDEKNESEFSNTLEYVKEIDFNSPVVLTTKEHNPLIIASDKNEVEGYLKVTNELSYNDIDYSAFLFEKIDEGYKIKLQNGYYLCYVMPLSYLDNKEIIAYNSYDEEDEAFLWNIKKVDDCYLIQNALATTYYQKSSYVLYNDNNTLIMKNHNDFDYEVDKASFIINNTSIKEFEESKIYEKTSFDINKPLIAYFKANSENYIIGIDNSSILNKTIVDNHLISKITYSKNVKQELYSSCAFTLEKMEGYIPIENGYLEGGGDFYRIRLASGKYLGMLKGSYIGDNSRDYFASSDYQEGDWWQYWQICFEKDNEIRLYNLGKNYDWWGEVNCAMNRDSNSNLGPNMYIYDQNYKDDFTLVLRNIDIKVNDTYKYKDLSGEKIITNLKAETVLSMSDETTNGYLKDSKESLNYIWTFEKVQELQSLNAYRIKNQNGMYLSFTSSTNYQLKQLNTNLETNEGKMQIFILNSVCGLKDAYRIGNYFYGGNFYKDNVLRYYLLTASSKIPHEGEHSDNVFTYYGQIDEKLLLEQIWFVKGEE